MSDTGTSGRKRSIRPSKRLNALAGEAAVVVPATVNTRTEKVMALKQRIADPAFEIDVEFRRAAARMLEVEFA